MDFKHSLKYWYEFLAQLTRFLDAPKFLREPTDISGEKGQDATLTCLVDGNPAPSYTWFKNGDFQTVISHRARFPDLQERNCSAGVCGAQTQNGCTNWFSANVTRPARNEYLTCPEIKVELCPVPSSCFALRPYYSYDYRRVPQPTLESRILSPKEDLESLRANMKRGENYYANCFFIPSMSPRRFATPKGERKTWRASQSQLWSRWQISALRSRLFPRVKKPGRMSESPRDISP